jgi:hypothetical protein
MVDLLYVLFIGVLLRANYYLLKGTETTARLIQEMEE